jgi:hydrogenase maturation protease
MKHQPSILLYGYGNPGRQDDGLGIRFIEDMEHWVKENELDFIKTDSNYQLNIEDSINICSCDTVFFIDATKEKDIEDYAVTEVVPSEEASFSTHSVSPEFLSGICLRLFKKTPKVYLIHIKGYEWEFKEGITEAAKKNLDNAFKYLSKYLLKCHNEELVIEA